MKNKRIFLMCLTIVILLIFLICFFIFAFYQRNNYEKKYKDAQDFIEAQEYDKAIEELKYLTNYKDSSELLKYAADGIIYLDANEFLKQNMYEKAIEKYNQILDFEDSKEKIKEAKYNLAIQYFESEDFDTSKMLFVELNGYNESEKYLDEIEMKKLLQLKKDIYDKACDLLKEKKYQEALDKFNSILDYSDSEKKAKECKNEQQKRLTTISAGINQYFAVTNEGKVICTDERYEFKDEKHDFEDWDNIISISYLDNIAIGLKEDGTTISEGHQNGIDIYEADASNWKNIIQVSAGQQHVVGLTNEGKVLTAGYEGFGLPDVESWNNISYIATGWMHTVGLDSDGEIHIVGYKSEEQLNEIKKNNSDNDEKNDWIDITAIAAAGGDSNNKIGGHTVGLREDGKVVAVGNNDHSQCEVYGEAWTDIIAIATGDWHTVGLRKDGTVVSTRPTKEQLKDLSSDSACRVDDWTNIIAIAAGRGFTIGLKSDGSIVYTGKISPGEKNWKDIKIYDNWDSIINQTKE